jgi:hypothetical protein
VSKLSFVPQTNKNSIRPNTIKNGFESLKTHTHVHKNTINPSIQNYPRPPTHNFHQIVAPAISSEPIPVIDQLYSPKFPLEVVQEFVMGAIQEAVEINQVHNRDPIGGSNENLFL